MEVNKKFNLKNKLFPFEYANCLQNILLTVLFHSVSLSIHVSTRKNNYNHSSALLLVL